MINTLFVASELACSNSGLGCPNLRSLVCQNCAMSACAKSGHWTLALELLAGLLYSGSPSNISFNTAITACEKSDQWEHAIALLDLCNSNGSADVVSFNAAIRALKAARWPCVLQLLDSMQARRILPDAFTYNAAISACEQWQHALSLLAAAALAGHDDAPCQHCSEFAHGESGEPRFMCSAQQ